MIEGNMTTRALGERTVLPNGPVPGLAGSLRDGPTDKRQSEVEAAYHQLNVVMDRLGLALMHLEGRLGPALIPAPELEPEKQLSEFGSPLAQSIQSHAFDLHRLEQRVQRLLNTLAL